jgi:hypothetical protein
MRVLVSALVVWLLLSVATAVVLSLSAIGARRGQDARRFAHRRRREDAGRA